MKSYFNDRRDMFFKNRLGLFIHWGIYAVAGWHEQHGYRGRVSRYEYAKLAKRFNPVDFNPSEWLDMAEENGFDYICFTTKHIDGFCMFDTEFTDFNIMNTPYGRDILKELADECHKRDFPLALYYSPIDRSHPSYPNFGGSYENETAYPEDKPNMEDYMEVMRGQVRELCQNYGEIYGFWWDGGRHMDHKETTLNELLRQLQPGILINNRGFSDGDFRTPERDWYEYVDKDIAFEVPTEACQSIGTESWGYRKDEEYYSTRYLMESMDKILAKDGNYLLNAGPMASGKFPKEAIDILSVLGSWYSRINESIYDAVPVTALTENKDILITTKEDKLYIHLYKYPKSSAVWLNPINIKPKSAHILNNNRAVDIKVEVTPLIWKENIPYLRISNLKVNELGNEVPVIVLEFDDIKKVLNSRK